MGGEIVNPITLNLPIAVAIEDCPFEAQVLQCFTPGWQATPLFQHMMTVEQFETGEIPLNPTMPFPLFRMHHTFFHELEGKKEVFTALVVSPSATSIYVVAYIKAFNMSFIILVTTSDVEKGRYMLPYVRSGRDPFKQVEDMSKAEEDVAGAILARVLAFGRDCMEPNNRIAKVQPAEECRSVEWIKARTHYTLITHGHPANNSAVKPGEEVRSDAKGELKRMAHNRRAHYKTLKHARYRFAMGKRVFVRATWVGPKEWRDEGGRQIYRILEPVQFEQ